MSDNFEVEFEEGAYQDYLVVRHPDGNSEKFPGPAYEGAVVRIGRELDNEVILTDPRASRYHAEIRRTDAGTLEIRDLGSANGVFVGSNKLAPESWQELPSGQTVQMAETRMFWETSVSSQPTVSMKPSKPEFSARQPTKVSSTPPPSPGVPTPQPTSSSMMPIIAGLAGLFVILAIVAGAVVMFSTPDQPPEVATEPTTSLEETATAPEATSEGRNTDLSEQAVGSVPTDTPTPSGPQMAIPIVNINSNEVQPILLGALPSTDKALLLVSVRVQNVGNLPFRLSTDDFAVRTRDGEEIFEEAGGDMSTDGLRRLGVVDRFDDLNLTPGGSVAEDLIFELDAETYDLELLFEPPDVSPIILGLGQFDVGQQLAIALGTPVAEETPTPTSAAVAVAETTGTPEEADATAETEETPTADATAETEETPTADATAETEETPDVEAEEAEAEDADAAPTATETPEPTPTPTRPPLIPAPKMVPQSSLVGTIAYPVFNGQSYDLYFGQADGSGTQFIRADASQPAFSPDGERIAFHSWTDEARGLAVMNVDGSNFILVATFIEDQLPTWTADGEEIIYLTRRTGDRKSQLFRTGSRQERSDGVIVEEGEYPTIGPTNQLAFKGWGSTAYGLRVGPPTLTSINTVTNVDEDTAPAFSPDGSQIAFMSRREGQWDIYIINTDGSGLRRLTTDEAEDGLPAWSPDGEAIAFVSSRGGSWAIWVMTPDGEGKSLIFTMEGSPDGFVNPDINVSRGWAEERISWTR